jgi:hypothetical protein
MGPEGHGNESLVVPPEDPNSHSGKKRKRVVTLSSTKTYIGIISIQ